ncbi:PPPDE domain-containing protein [Vairimorpha necatrix]|uniref:PPPDE domain-containing protein n=1 Tax=Vairimorpha necatrix TaxID=6039 RepID=A0AAX4JAB0_9MICR
MEVILRVYKIGNQEILMLLNKLTNKNFEGIWHTSIEVFGKEYFFSHEIIRAQPGSTKHKDIFKKHVMGTTVITEEEFELFLENQNELFGSNTYDLLKNNCNHFTNVCLQFLTNKQNPEYIMEVHEAALKNEFISNLVKMAFQNLNRF